MNYQFFEYPDGETCTRCASDIHSGWEIDGKKYGPTCGKIILKQAGITWPKMYGPGSFDSATMKAAIELAKRHRRNGRKWNPTLRKEVSDMRYIVGSNGWNIAWGIAIGSALRLPTDDAMNCYQAATR